MYNTERLFFRQYFAQKSVQLDTLTSQLFTIKFIGILTDNLNLKCSHSAGQHPHRKKMSTRLFFFVAPRVNQNRRKEKKVKSEFFFASSSFFLSSKYNNLFYCENNEYITSKFILVLRSTLTIMILFKS